ncbi:MAG TPA: flippase [Thermoplasmata archaeon]|nr:flippase [Thermoplasmata archaeon]
MEPSPKPGPTAATPLGRTIQSVGRGATAMAVATICLLAFQFLARVLVTRSVSVPEWGEFSLALALTSLLALLAAFGIPTAVARSLAFEPTYDERVRVVRGATLFSVAVSAVSTVFLYFFAPQIASGFHDASLAGVLQLFALTIPFAILSNVLAGFFQGMERAEPNAIFNQIVNPGLFLLFAWLLIYFGWHLTGAVVGYLIAYVLSFAALAVYSALRLPATLRASSTESFVGDVSGRVPLLELSITLFGISTLSYVTSFGDTLVLGIFRSTPVVGQYSSAMTLARLFLVGSGAITYIYLPVSARLRREGDYGTVRQSYVTSARWLVLITLPLFLLFTFDPANTLAVTFGALYLNAASSLQILAIGSFVAVMVGPAASCLGGLGRSRPMLIFTLTSAVANVALSFTLIPWFGLTGAAYAWSVARVLYPALCLAFLWSAYGVHPFAAHYLKPLGLSLAILLPIFLLTSNYHGWYLLPILFVLVVVVYVGSILATRSVDPGDIIVFRGLERRLGIMLPRLERLLAAREAPAPSPAPPAVG